MKHIIFSLILFLCITFDGNTQSNLDSIFTSLNNKDLFIAPILYNPWESLNENVNKDSFRLKKRLFIVSSLNSDIQDLAKKYSKKVIVEKLYNLLQDPQKDLYANALLYDLLDNRKLGKLLYMKREKWVDEGRNLLDKQHWEGVKSKGSYLQ